MLDVLTSWWSELLGGTPTRKLSKELSTGLFRRSGYPVKHRGKAMHRHFLAIDEQESPHRH